MTLSRLTAVQWLIFTAVVATLFYLLSPILTPFVAAAIFAYICNPLVNRLEQYKLPRSAAVGVVMLLLTLLLVILLLIVFPLLQKEISLLITRLPDGLEMLRVKLLPHLQALFGINLTWDNGSLKQFALNHLQNAGSVAGQVLPWLSSRGGAIVGAIINILLIPVAMFYLLRDWNGLLTRLDALIPRPWHSKILEIMAQVDNVLAEFLRGQISVMLLMSGFYSLTLWLTGLEFALPIGLVAGMLVFVPYLGMILGLVLATLAATMQFTVFSNVLWVWVAFGSGQLLEGMLITPWLVGERVGLHPLAVIFALLAFGQLFGFFGILLALPMSAILLVALRHSHSWYLNSNMYRKL
jgi:predicted PurR-regulated permease PerM